VNELRWIPVLRFVLGGQLVGLMARNLASRLELARAACG
jgi:hypothetical protein